MADQGDILQNLGSDQRMLLDNCILFLGEFCRFVQNRIRNSDFADIMQIGGLLEVLHIFVTPVKRFREAGGIFRNTEGMSFRVFILRFQRSGEHLHDLQRDFLQLLLTLTKFIFLTRRFQFVDMPDGANDIDEKKNQRPHSNKDPGD